MLTKVKSSKKIVSIALSLVILMTSFVSLPTLKASALNQEEIKQIGNFIDYISDTEKYLNSEDETIKKFAKEIEDAKLLDYMEIPRKSDNTKGHTLERHVDKTKEYLQTRIKNEMAREYKKYLVRECMKDEALVKDLNEDAQKYLLGDIKISGLDINSIAISGNDIDEMSNKFLEGCKEQIDKCFKNERNNLYNKIDKDLMASYGKQDKDDDVVLLSENNSLMNKCRFAFDGLLSDMLIELRNNEDNNEGSISSYDIFKIYLKGIYGKFFTASEKIQNQDCLEAITLVNYEFEENDVLRYRKNLYANTKLKAEQTLKSIDTILEIQKGINTLIEKEKKNQISKYIETQYKNEEKINAFISKGYTAATSFKSQEEAANIVRTVIGQNKEYIIKEISKWTGDDSKDRGIELTNVHVKDLKDKATGYKLRSYIANDGSYENIENFETVTLVLIPDSNSICKFKVLTCYPEYIDPLAAKAA